MHYHRRRTWEIATSQTTPERLFLNRRALLAGGALLAAFSVGGGGFASPAAAEAVDGTASLYPAKRNEAYKLDRETTPEKITSNYNNFYEFSTSKHLSADPLKLRPWTITIDGMVEKPFEIGIEDLVKAMGVEERLYRHRCVEAWSMAIPWSGFPLRALVERARPLGSAKYVRFESFLDKKIAPGQRDFSPWPYIEGLTMAEAANDLAFMVTGAYSKPLAKVYGAPIRLATPWKYGFKSAKSIVKISFVEKRPTTFWESLGPEEYGFWANVNPDVPHPRWSQASETFLNTGDRRPTLLFNGYGEQVADLYKGLEKEPLYM
ncbi:MAG: protein-methionine-sulfoxide reductase catalytic subunit MsrP [Roseiarcus sp.]